MTDVVEIWRYQGGGFISNDFVYGVAAAADNSVYLVGTQDGHETLGVDLAVVKVDSDGDQLWDWQDGSEGDQILFSAAAVVDGVVGSGYINGTWNEDTSTEGTDFAVVKLYSNGTVAWRWQEGTDGDDILYAATETLDGNVVVAGITQGSWSDINDGWNDVAVAKLNVDDGEVIWRYQAGTSGESGAYVRAATTRGDGSVVLGGFTFGSFAKTFSGGDGATDFLAIALGEDGDELWRWQDGPGTGLSVVLGIAAFDDDSVLLVGMTEGTWGSNNFGGHDFAVTKLNGSGDMEWSWQGGTEFEEEFSGAAIGMDGFVVMSGYTNGSWATTKEGVDDMDFAAMSMNVDGDILWRYQAGNTSNDDFNGVAVRPDGSMVLGGWTSGIWTTSESSDWLADFAAVLLYTNMSTSSPTSSPVSYPTSSLTPETISYPTPNPVPSPTTTPTTYPTSEPIPPPTSEPIALPTPEPVPPLALSPTLSPTPYPTPYPTPPAIPSPTPSPTLSPGSQPAVAPLGPSSLNDFPDVEPRTSTESESETSKGLIIGCSIGGVAVIAILIACCFCWWSGANDSTTRPHLAPSRLPAPSVSAVAREQGSNVAGANAVAIPPPPVYSDPPPAYSGPLPAHFDPPPIYSDSPPAYPNRGFDR